MALTASELGAAQTQEDKFQSLYDSGAFEHRAAPEKPPEAKAAPEPTPEAPAPKAEATGSPDEPPETPEYKSFDEYLEKSGLERESFLKLPVKVKVDEQDVDIPLEEALRSYSREEHFTRKSQDLATRQQAWESERSAAFTALEGQLKQAKTLGELARQSLMQEFQGINWNDLYQRDPGQWSATQQLFNNRAAQIENHLNQVQQQEQQLAQQKQADFQKALSGEREKMFKAIPEWRDEAKFSAAKAAMRAYAKSMGFTDAEIDGISDHRHMRVLLAASQAPNLQAKVETKLKQVRAAPQISNAGARVTRDPQQAAFKQAKERWGKNPRDQDAAVEVFSHF